MILHFYRFRKTGSRIFGRVTGIEKHISETRINNRRTRQIFFRPIVEYFFNGKTHITFGASFNEIRHKLGQSVSIFVKTSEDHQHVQAMLDDKLPIWVAGLIAFSGLVCIFVYCFVENGNMPLAVIVVFLLTAVGYVVSTAILQFNTKLVDMSPPQPHQNAKIINTEEAYQEIVSSHSFWGSVIAFSFMFLSFGMIYGGFDMLPNEARQLFQDDSAGFWLKIKNGNLPESWVNALILLGAGLFCFLASLRSIYYVRKKYGTLLKR